MKRQTQEGKRDQRELVEDRRDTPNHQKLEGQRTRKDQHLKPKYHAEAPKDAHQQRECESKKSQPQTTEHQCKKLECQTATEAR